MPVQIEHPKRTPLRVTELPRIESVSLLELLQVRPSRIASTVDGCAVMYRRMLSRSRTLVVVDNAQE